MAEQTKVAPEAEDPARVAKLEELAARAQSGDKAAIAELGRVLDENPQLWQTVGDLSAHVEKIFIDLLAGNNRLVAESLVRQVASMRMQFLGDSPSPAQKMVVDEIIAAWLSIKHAEIKAAEPSDDHLNRARFYEKRLEAARRQFLAAIRLHDSLARMREGGRFSPRQHDGQRPQRPL